MCELCMMATPIGSISKYIKILNNQWNDSEKAELADFVIENINKLDTEKKVNKLMSNIISIYEKD